MNKNNSATAIRLIPLFLVQLSMSLKQTVFDFTVKDAANKDLSLCLYKGKALLIMNVASKCGFTQGGYTTANELLRKYKSVGFDVLAFPCNQFAKQEPGDAAS
ncbi:Glutathione peroxidase, partial [Perkinsela sp. CCAP 1560/4]